MGVRVIVPSEPTYRDEWKRASPDGLVVDVADRVQYGLEVKTADARLYDDWGEAGSDQVPLQYVCQTAWSMHVLDLPRWDLAALIGGNDDRIYRLHRDREFEADLVEGVTDFWTRYVVRREPPPVDASREYRDYLTRRYARTTGELRQATGEEELLVAEVLGQRLRARREQGKADYLENQLRAAIGEADGLIGQFGRVTLRPQVRRTVDWQAVTRVLAAREQLSTEFLEQLAEEHTQVSDSFRVLRLPRQKEEGCDE
jgi:predicted phage-related endonuclease